MIRPALLVVCATCRDRERRAGRGRAAHHLALRSPRDGDVELQRQRGGAVRRHRARHRRAAVARQLRHRRHRHRAAAEHRHLPQGADARHLGQLRVARVRERAVLSGGAHQPAAAGDRQCRHAAPPPARASTISRCPSAATRRPSDASTTDTFRKAFIKLKDEHGLYRQEANGVTFLTPALFQTSIALPAEVPTGTYEIDVKLFLDGMMIARTPSALEIYKAGFEQFVSSSAQTHGVLYGLAASGDGDPDRLVRLGGVPPGLIGAVQSARQRRAAMA